MESQMTMRVTPAIHHLDLVADAAKNLVECLDNAERPELSDSERNTTNLIVTTARELLRHRLVKAGLIDEAAAA